MNTNINKVHFVGAGPGDKELITLKGYKLLSNADVVIYAGSLVIQNFLIIVRKVVKYTTVLT